ncbi:MAG: amino acid racemase [Alphaproteobacteria bacterium]|nr:amino acid racemase [Alphaproteobacteria bacterium]
MRKLGMIGGTSWHSTAMYYDQINKGVARKLGGLSSARLILESLNLAEVAPLQLAGEWGSVAEILAGAARRLEAAGAEGLIICSNTGHKVAAEVEGAVGIPLLHMGDAVGARLAEDGVKRAGLLGTRFTMAEPFVRERIEARGVALTPPAAATAQEIDRIIFEELAKGLVTRNSQRRLKTCLTEMGQARQQAVVLACTELVLLVDPVANVLPVYDTTALHAKAAVEWITA